MDHNILEKQKLNTTPIYILSVLGLLCCCFLGFGIIPSTISLFLSNKQYQKAIADYENYDNIKSMKTARIISLIVFIINLIMVARVLYVFSTIGYDDLMELYNETLQQYEQTQ